MTVDWHDHARVIADYLIFIKLTHVLGGVFIWDFVLNLDFEYSILRGKRRLTWTSPLYLGSRWSSLSLVIVQFLALDSDGSHAIDCQAVIVMVFVFAYLTLLFASALIALRVTALWEYNKIVVAIAFTSWLANVIIYVYSTAKSRGYWVEGECVIQHTFHSNISVFSTLASDFLLVTLMLGLAWVLVVALAEIPPAVFIALNLNDPMNMVFQGVGLVIMSIGASRIYRGLVKFPSANSTPLETAAMDQLREPQRGSFGSSLHLVGGTGSAGGAQVYAHV
ncbi:hypothetical protein EDB84DRAFT_878017 [Lactarius hengduanensis]|nr:hypothetical protein EDB84DRAFT_878017 [Lactarius hengduanensis]